MLKKTLAISIFSIVISVTKVVAMTATVDHGLFGKLEVVNHKEDIESYNNWCLKQKQSVDDTNFLGMSCANKCFQFNESIHETSYRRAEAEDLLKSIAKNPVTASAMKVLISKYNKYDEKILAKCEFTKDLERPNRYEPSNVNVVYKFISKHNINVCPTNDESLFFDINKQDKQWHKPSIRRILTHEMMHFMDTVLRVDEYNSNKSFLYDYNVDYLDAETLKRHTPCNSLKIDEVADKLTNQLSEKVSKKDGMSYLQRVLLPVYDTTYEMYGMYGLKKIFHQATYRYTLTCDDEEDEEIVQCKPEIRHDYKLAYEPINDAMSHLYGFGEDDNIVGKIRTSHKTNLNKYPDAISTLEDSFHIYSFYKQPDVQKAFKFSTKVIEEA